MQRALELLFVIVCMVSCMHSSKDKTPATAVKKADSLILETYYHPAFIEFSSIKLLKVDTIQTIEILIRKNYPGEKTKDTFYFKRVPVSLAQYKLIDSGIIKNVRAKYEQKNSLNFDGMYVLFQLITGKDTLRKRFFSPLSDEETFGYTMVKSSIDNYKTIFNDTIISDYLHEVETYIDESKNRSLHKSKRAIDDFRIKVYN